MIARRYDEPNQGQAAKQTAHKLLESRRAVYIRRGRRALVTALLATGRATADDVRRMIELPDDIDPVCLGCVPAPLAKAGIIRGAGYAKTTRPTGHARPITVWELADSVAAVQWLEENPDMEDHSTAAAPSGGTPFSNSSEQVAPDSRKEPSHE